MTEGAVGPRLRIAVLAAAAVLLLTALGSLDASAPDEPRYLQVAEELRSLEHGLSGVWLLHLNGEVYTQKPPLYFWMAAAIGAPFGHVSEAAARLPSALAGIAAVALTALLGARLLGGRVGVLGAALLLTVFSFGQLARRVQLDVLLTAFELAALTSFWWLDRGLGRRWRHQALLHLAMGLAVLTKGPVGFLLPSLSIVAYLGWERRWTDLRRAFPWWGFLVSLGPGLLWIVTATALAPAGYAQDAVGTNLFGRFFAGTSHARPFYYYFYQFPVDFLPWTLLWPLVYLAGRRVLGAQAEGGEETRRAWRFLVAIVGTSFVFFTISSGKRGLYMVPVFPAAALLTADALVRWLGGRARPPAGLLALGVLMGVLGAALGVEAILAGSGRPVVLRPEQAAALDGRFLQAFGAAMLAVVVLAVAGWGALRRNRAPVLTLATLLVAATWAADLSVFTLLFRAFEPITSPRALAVAAAAYTEPGDSIGLVGDRAMAGGLAYYGHRHVAELDTAEDVQAFVDDGGKALVVKRRKLARVPVPVNVVWSERTGRREVLVVTPRRPGGEAPQGPSAAAGVGAPPAAP